MPDHPLDGCRSRPLIDYLKALGVLRLVATQEDATACGSWRDDLFVLHTSLDKDALEQFFLQRYQPTPILAPWNKDSGFWKETGKATNAVGNVASSRDPRLRPMRRAISEAKRILRAIHEEDPASKEDKAVHLGRFRAGLPDDCLEWFDAAVVLTEDGVRYPALLGSGGNDSRLEFSSTFLQQVLAAFAPRKATDAREHLRAALGGGGARPLARSTGGQLFPGSVGGPNSTTGFEGDPVLNPWDYILALEGAVVLAGASVRRFGDVSASQASFPFMVDPTGVGYATGGLLEEFAKGARGEIWMPLWARPATFREVRRLFAEGRAQLGRRRARNGVELLRAIRELGVDRGVVAFERYAFMQRSGNAHLAAPLGRVAVTGRPAPGVEVLHDLDGWLGWLRAAARPDNVPPRYRAALLAVERAIYEFALAPEARPLARVLEAAGEAEQFIPGAGVPLQDLRAEWVLHCDDGSPEFRIGAALADLVQRLPDARAFLEPVERHRKTRRFQWKSDGACCPSSWAARSLAQSLSQFLERLRLCGHDPFTATRFRARLKDVSLFLHGQLDEVRLRNLLFGLLAVDLSTTPTPRFAPVAAPPIPRVYAVFKLLALAERVQPDGERWTAARRRDPEEPLPRVDGTMLALIRTGRLDAALRQALLKLRASGYEPALGLRHCRTASLPAAARSRLAAALLIPVTASAALAELVLLPPVPVQEGESR